jgi:hypothetical protein
LSKQSQTVLYLYRKLLILYPASYRHEYEEEMIDTIQIMLADANTASDQWNLLWRACKEYIISLTQQNILAFENTASNTPDYVRRSSEFSTSLMLPFFIICSYNWLNQYILHHAIPYGEWESKTWIIYCIILPILAGIVLSFAGAKSLIENIRSRQNIASQWLLLGIPFTLLIILILM